jgi:S-DNA-T family DNA segregation ATPase FtsK/SpoIIIE
MAKKKTGKQKKENAKIDITYLRGLICFSSSLALMLSLLSFAYGHSQNWLGLVGSHVGWFFHALFGIGSYLLCIFLGWAGWRQMFLKPIHHPLKKVLFIALFLLSFCMLLNLLEHTYPSVGTFLRQLFYPNLWQRKMRFHLGGAPLFYFYYDLPSLNLYRILNTLGVALLCFSSLIASTLYLAKIHPSKLLQACASGWKSFREIHWKGLFTKKASSSDDLRMVKLRTADSAPLSLSTSPDLLAIQPETNLKVRPSLSRKELTEPTGSIPFAGEARSLPPKAIALTSREPEKITSPQKKREAAIAAQKVYNGDFTGFKLPTSSHLTNPKKIDQNLLRKDLRRQAEVLEETLLSFGIEAKVGQINCGPTITSFEVHPAIGVKVQKIKTLENDIALNMEAKSIRIIAPIPGKAAVGIEVPNPLPQEVSFKEMLTSYQQSGKSFHIPLLLGKAVNGDNVVNDLTKMPHCIIAGATGSGKSVCINTIIMSILMTARPDEIKLLMVDPKKVELTPYTRLPHMLAPVITEPQGACAALNWLVKEMEIRYEILKLLGTRNIEAFNTRKIDKQLEESLDKEIPAKMPYIVGIIDELADLMMVANQDIETPIARIAQMARAVGIHLILATQRPSREVITGLIKANFPTRISFKVASRVNSQIILDEIGAESLLGNGDMLFLPPGSSHLIRAQGAFIRDEDINAVVKHICDQAPPNYVIESFDQYRSLDANDIDEENAPTDLLYQDALDIILSTGNASTTFLQRKLKIGYARAASLMDQLEMQGVVGPADGSKARKILVSKKGNPASQENGESFDEE